MSEFVAGSVGLQIAVGGVLQWDERLEGIMRRIEDMTPALEAIANHFQAHMKEVFTTQGSDTRAGAWKPLNAKYAARKAIDFPGMGILEASGALRDAMEGRGDDAIRRVEAQELEVGGSREVSGKSGTFDLGWIHQLGEGRVPPRPIIDIPDHVQSDFVHVLADHVRGQGAF